jgi:hypothetical protein
VVDLLPDEAQVSLPGLALAQATSSGSDFTGSDGVTTQTSGTDPATATGTRSFARS